MINRCVKSIENLVHVIKKIIQDLSLLIRLVIRPLKMSYEKHSV
jgi:hypothetical protein